MTDTHITSEKADSGLRENITSHAIALALVETTSGTAGSDTSGVLTTVLKEVSTLKKLSRSNAVRIGQKKT